MYFFISMSFLYTVLLFPRTSFKSVASRGTTGSRGTSYHSAVSRLNLHLLFHNHVKNMLQEGPHITAWSAGSWAGLSVTEVLLGRPVWRVWTTSPSSHLKEGKMGSDLCPARPSADCLLGQGVQVLDQQVTSSRAVREGTRGQELGSTLATYSSSSWPHFTLLQPLSPH